MYASSSHSFSALSSNRCPLCQEVCFKEELKPAGIVFEEKLQTGDDITFKLLVKIKSDKLGIIYSAKSLQESTSFARFIKILPQEASEILEKERVEVERFL